MKINIEKSKFYQFLQEENSDLNNKNPLEFEENLKDIINLHPEKLMSKIDEIENYLKANFSQNLQEIKDFLKEKYGKAYEKLRDELGAEIIKDKNYTLCPYCKVNYISLVSNDNKILKPDLDHFYPKSEYPYLAVTFSNLIPSCLVCNSRLKNSKIPSIKINDATKIIDKIKFKADPTTKNIYVSNLNEFSQDEKKWLAQMMTQEIYCHHTEILDNILEKFKKYKNSRIEEISKNILELTRREIKNTVFAEYKIIKKDNEPLYKLKTDLYDQFKK